MKARALLAALGLSIVVQCACVPASPSLTEAIMNEDSGIGTGRDARGASDEREAPHDSGADTVIGGHPPRDVSSTSPTTPSRTHVYVELVFRIFSAPVSILLLVVLFFDEQKERLAHEKIATLWIRLDDRQSSALTRHVSTVHKIAALTDLALDRLFGKKLLSLRAALVSTLLSVATLCGIAWCAVSAILWFGGTTVLGEALAKYQCVPPQLLVGAGYALSGILGLISLMVGFCAFLPLALRDDFLIGWEALAVVFLTSLLPLLGIKSGASVLTAILLGLACDVLFVAALRSLLRRMQTWTHSTIALLVPFGTLVLAVLIVAVPGISGMVLFRTSTRAGLLLLFVAASNVYDSVVAAVYFVVGFGNICHRLAWPSVKAPIYALQRHQFVTNHKKLVLIAAMSLLSVGIFGFPSWLQSLILKF